MPSQRTLRDVDRSEFRTAGWLLIAVSTLGVAVSVIPVSILTLGVFIKPLSAEFGWGRGPISLALSILSVAMAVAMPIAGRSIDQFGVRRPMLLSLVGYGAGVAVLPAVIDRFGLTGFYVDAAWIGFAGSASSSVAYVKVLSRWFDKSRGLALGFVMSGVAVGGAIAPGLAAALIQHGGWRAGFHGLALLPTLIGIPIAFLLREAPAHELGTTVRGSGSTVGEAARNWIFWVLLPLFFISAAANHAIQIHLPALLSDRGLSIGDAAMGVSFMFIVSAIVRLAAGFSFDRIFPPRVGAACFAAAFIGSFVLIPHSTTMTYFTAVALCGAGAGAESDLLAILVSRYFGMRSFATLYGWLFASFMTGSALGPYLLGAAFDLSGNYELGLLGCGGGLAIVATLLLTLPKFPGEILQAASPVRSVSR